MQDDKFWQKELERNQAALVKKQEEERKRRMGLIGKQHSLSILETFFAALKKILTAIFGKPVAQADPATDKPKDETESVQAATAGGGVGSDGKQEEATEKAAAKAVAEDTASAQEKPVPAAPFHEDKGTPEPVKALEEQKGMANIPAKASTVVPAVMGHDDPREAEPAPVKPAAIPAEIEAFLAAREGDVDKLDKFLLDGLSSDIRDKDGHTLLHIAAKHGNVMATDFLLEQGSDPYAQDNEGKTAYELTKDPHVRERLSKKMDEIDALNERGGLSPGM